jgi:hypothetical protein
MFPWIYGFEWTPGYVLFLGVFFVVLLMLVGTLGFVAVRSLLDFRAGRAPSIQWQSVFHDLPRASRACRHAMTGRLPGRVCEQGFDCRECRMHGRLAGPGPASDVFYHRGHCWVRPLEDGTVLVGLDELGRRLIGQRRALKLPAPGVRLVANAPAFEAERNKSTIRVLAPVDGEVVAVGGADDDWLLKLRRQGSLDTRHLLRGAEVRAWREREFERLQLLACQADGPAALADGGELLDDLGSVFTGRQWEVICGQMLLDP